MSNENRVCAVRNVITNGMTGYLYDGGGARVAKGAVANMNACPVAQGFASITAQYLLGPGGEQVTELDGSGNWQHTNLFAAGRLLATYNSSGQHFHFTDWLGTRRAQTTAAGVSEEQCQSLPFGDGLSCSGSGVDATEHHFTGKERDSESGNDYFGARYYSSAMGRFMSPDWSAKVEPVPYSRLDDPQTLNLYAYLMNNPLGGVDADGHCGGPGETGPDCGSLGKNNPATQVQPQMRQEVHREAVASNKPAPGDKHGGNHEEAGEQHGKVVAPAVPGAAGKLTHSGANNPLESDPFNAKNPAQNLNANSNPNDPVVQSHAHPGGTDTILVSPQNTSSALITVFGGTIPVSTAFWQQTPSAVDIKNALPAPNLNIVVGAGTTGNPNNQPTVYFYTPAGTTCHVPLSQF